MLKTILMVIYVIVCIVLAIVVLSQEGKDASLTSSISGAGGGFDNSYWSKNKGSSKQEILWHFLMNYNRMLPVPLTSCSVEVLKILRSAETIWNLIKSAK